MLVFSKQLLGHKQENFDMTWVQEWMYQVMLYIVLMS